MSLIWRRLRPGDITALRDAHAQQCAASGAEFALPDFSDPRYLLAKVAERDGRAIGALAFHATLEAMFVGGDAGMVRDAIRRRSELENELRRAGADEVHAFVPRAALRRMEPLLQRLGFRRSNETFVTFYREL